MRTKGWLIEAQAVSILNCLSSGYFLIRYLLAPNTACGFSQRENWRLQLITQYGESHQQSRLNCPKQPESILL